MGDHRANIKIEMEFHGVTDKADMWINYCDSDGRGVDSRVTEVFMNAAWPYMKMKEQNTTNLQSSNKKKPNSNA